MQDNTNVTHLRQRLIFNNLQFGGQAYFGPQCDAQPGRSGCPYSAEAAAGKGDAPRYAGAVNAAMAVLRIIQGASKTSSGKERRRADKA